MLALVKTFESVRGYISALLHSVPYIRVLIFRIKDRQYLYHHILRSHVYFSQFSSFACGDVNAMIRRSCH